jgi:hypothetical protein
VTLRRVLVELTVTELRCRGVLEGEAGPDGIDVLRSQPLSPKVVRGLLPGIALVLGERLGVVPRSLSAVIVFTRGKALTIFKPHAGR